MSAYSKWAGLGGGANYLSRESQLVRSPTFPSPHLLLRGNWLHNSITVLLQSSQLFVAGVFQLGNRWWAKSGCDCGTGTDLLKQHCSSNEVHGKRPKIFFEEWSWSERYFGSTSRCQMKKETNRVESLHISTSNIYLTYINISPCLRVSIHPFHNAVSPLPSWTINCNLTNVFVYIYWRRKKYFS